MLRLLLVRRQLLRREQICHFFVELLVDFAKDGFDLWLRFNQSAADDADRLLDRLEAVVYGPEDVSDLG